MSNSNRTSLFFGLALIVVGVLFLLYNVGALPPEMASLWPLLVIGAGLWVMSGAVLRRRRGGVLAGTVLLTAGTFWILQNFGRVRPEAFGPVMIIAVGVGLLLRSFVRPA